MCEWICSPLHLITRIQYSLEGGECTNRHHHLLQINASQPHQVVLGTNSSNAEAGKCVVTPRLISSRLQCREALERLLAVVTQSHNNVFHPQWDTYPSCKFDNGCSGACWGWLWLPLCSQCSVKQAVKDGQIQWRRLVKTMPGKLCTSTAGSMATPQ